MTIHENSLLRLHAEAWKGKARHPNLINSAPTYTLHQLRMLCSVTRRTILPTSTEVTVAGGSLYQVWKEVS